MPSGLVNQLMSCYWIEMGHELESCDEKESSMESAMQKLESIQKTMKKIRFDF